MLTNMVNLPHFFPSPARPLAKMGENCKSSNSNKGGRNKNSTNSRYYCCCSNNSDDKVTATLSCSNNRKQ